MLYAKRRTKKGLGGHFLYLKLCSVRNGLRGTVNRTVNCNLKESVTDEEIIGIGITILHGKSVTSPAHHVFAPLLLRGTNTADRTLTSFEGSLSSSEAVGTSFFKSKDPTLLARTGEDSCTSPTTSGLLNCGSMVFATWVRIGRHASTVEHATRFFLRTRAADVPAARKPSR